MATTRIRSGAIEVDGLAELNRTMRELGGKELQRELRDANKEVASEEADRVQSALAAAGGMFAKVAPTVKASAGVTSAGVGFGGATAPFFAGAEFGADRDKDRTRSTGSYVGYRQFKPHKGREGYVVYPTIRRDAERIEETYLEHIDRLTERFGLS